MWKKYINIPYLAILNFLFFMLSILSYNNHINGTPNRITTFSAKSNNGKSVYIRAALTAHANIYIIPITTTWFSVTDLKRKSTLFIARAAPIPNNMNG